MRWPLVGIAKRVTYVIGQDNKVLSAFRNERDMTAHAAHACEIVGGPRPEMTARPSTRVERDA